MIKKMATIVGMPITIILGILMVFGAGRQATASGVAYQVQNLSAGQMLLPGDTVSTSSYSNWGGTIKGMRIWYWNGQDYTNKLGCLRESISTTVDSCPSDTSVGDSYELISDWGTNKPFKITAIYFGTGSNDEVIDIDITFAPDESVGLQDVAVTDGETASFMANVTIGAGSNIDGYEWQFSDDGGQTWATLAGISSSRLDVAFNDPVYKNGNLFRTVVAFDGTKTMTSTTAALLITGQGGSVVPGVPDTGGF